MKNKKFWIFIALIILVVFLNHMFGWSEYLGNTENLTFLETLIEENLAAAIAVYLAVTVIGSVVLALPGVTFAIVAGLLFGPLLGTVLCTVAATLGASLAFLAGRFFLKDSIRPTAMKNKYLKKWLFDESGKNQLFVLMITRLVPLFPFICHTVWLRGMWNGQFVSGRLDGRPKQNAQQKRSWNFQLLFIIVGVPPG